MSVHIPLSVYRDCIAARKDAKLNSDTTKQNYALVIAAAERGKNLDRVNLSFFISLLSSETYYKDRLPIISLLLYIKAFDRDLDICDTTNISRNCKHLDSLSDIVCRMLESKKDVFITDLFYNQQFLSWMIHKIGVSQLIILTLKFPLIFESLLSNPLLDLDNGEFTQIFEEMVEFIRETGIYRPYLHLFKKFHSKQIDKNRTRFFGLAIAFNDYVSIEQIFAEGIITIDDIVKVLTRLDDEKGVRDILDRKQVILSFKHQIAIMESPAIVCFDHPKLLNIQRTWRMKAYAISYLSQRGFHQEYENFLKSCGNL